MTALVLALAGAYGVHLIYTAGVYGWRGVGPGPGVRGVLPARSTLRDWLAHAGLDGVRPAELAAAGTILAILGAAAAFAVFGGALPAVAGGGLTMGAPVAAARARRDRRRVAAREAWPRLIEEVRIRTSTLGRSLPQALFEAGERAPEEMRPAFGDARREWLLSTDFSRTVGVLKARLADSTADGVCETLLVANEIGGSDIDRCLTALVDDRIHDLQARKDARARQAGARFARRFVLVVPFGMALVGLTIGDGRAAYQTPLGQLLVVAGVGLVALCWLWAARSMRLPDEQRVFPE